MQKRCEFRGLKREIDPASPIGRAPLEVFFLELTADLMLNTFGGGPGLLRMNCDSLAEPRYIQ
jgi:hypothetical protein